MAPGALVRSALLSYQTRRKSVGWVKRLMTKFVGICVVLFVFAVGFIVLTQAQDLAALFGALRAEPLTQKLAWFLIVLIPIALIPSALWLCDSLLRQRKAADALEIRLGGVKQGVNALALSQVDADAAIHHLARSDPEAAIGAVTERLAEAERVLQVQQNRNAVGNLQTRVDALRAQQQGLRERLVPALEKRRSIEQLFAELDSREHDIDNALAEIASGDDAIAIGVRLSSLTEFIRRGHERCDEIEQASKTLSSLKNDYGALGERLVPYAAADDGVMRRVKELGEVRDRMAADIEALQQTPQGSLAARVSAFADEKKKLDDGMANLEAQFSKLGMLRRDVEGLSAGFDRALDRVAVNGKGEGDADSRVAELSEFIRTTQAQFEEIERAMTRFGKLRAELGDLQSRLVPLEAKDGGIEDLVAQVKDICDRLVAKIARIEADESGDLAARVRTFAETKQELEKRVSSVAEHFSQLATIRSDIAGLFDKLSNAADASSN
jgi:DNA repair exonuclease SbcCD ATPase subunit